ncbi:LytR/AlgR family response regulator transcription factor [Luteimicrobium sp. NPDC057192]|uniref:LytR/AlgR family response regulator transcription factor n=1 Tax=Luteimicrobium sp. NPDC057192 TaxID=3346042 RepID=UPI0036429107
MTAPLRVLVVDDEAPARDELAYLLGRDARVGPILAAGSVPDALRVLRDAEVDAVFLDVAMPGLDGLDLAATLARFRDPPAVTFVTAHAEHAVTAFELSAVDYLLKPVRESRLREAIRRIQAERAAPSSAPADPVVEPTSPPPPDDAIAVELGGVTRLVARSQVRYVEAHGDYSRLHTDDGSHLVRLTVTSLEARWRPAGFVRVHRSVLVSLAHVEEVRESGGRVAVVVEGRELPVSRRHAPALREALRRTRRAPG